MAPEAMAGTVNQACDVYSFGMLIYQVRHFHWLHVDMA
jgi:hypothetical protein